MKIFFTSDQHLNDWTAPGRFGRPFANATDMAAKLMHKWNAKVAPDDCVYVLGDFSFGAPAILAGARRNLRGLVVLIDDVADLDKYASAGFQSMAPTMDIEVDGKRLHLSHLPPPADVAAKYDHCLHGHVHEGYKTQGNLINVGVDVREYEPKTLAELLA